MKLTSLVLALALAPAALFAADNSSPTVIPGGSFNATYVISASGSYVLGGNRSANTSIYVIEIAAPDVTLNLNGFRLSNASGPSNWGGGINIPAPENVEIRNGSIVDAGTYGIKADQGKGLRVVDVRVSGGTYGLMISTSAARVDRCDITDSTYSGIYAVGAGMLITDCVVNGTANTLGVNLSNGSRAIRTVARGCLYGFKLYFYATAADCTASGGGIGFYLSDGCTLRGSESVNNNQGVAPWQSCVIKDTRITHNTVNVTGSGTYVNGGGNVIQ